MPPDTGIEEGPQVNEYGTPEAPTSVVEYPDPAEAGISPDDMSGGMSPDSPDNQIPPEGTRNSPRSKCRPNGKFRIGDSY